MSDATTTEGLYQATITAAQKKIAELERNLRLAESARDYANDVLAYAKKQYEAERQRREAAEAALREADKEQVDPVANVIHPVSRAARAHFSRYANANETGGGGAPSPPEPALRSVITEQMVGAAMLAYYDYHDLPFNRVAAMRRALSTALAESDTGGGGAPSSPKPAFAGFGTLSDSSWKASLFPASGARYTGETRPAGSNADEWQLFLQNWLRIENGYIEGTAFLCVQIAEAIDAAEIGSHK